MRNLFVIAAAGLAAIATPAAAQDEAAGSFHIGVITGYDSVRLDDGVDHGSEGDIMYGLTAGYDYTVSQTVVLGIEAEFADSSVSESAVDVITPGDQIALNAGNDLYAGLRLGVKIGANSLVYVKGGYTTGSVELEYDDGVDSFSESDDLGGYRVGIGAEFALSDRFALRGEYRYSDYGEYSYDGLATGLSASRHQGVVGLVAKF